MTNDPRVVTGREPARTGAIGEREQLGETKACRCTRCTDSASRRVRNRGRTAPTIARRNSSRRSSVTCGRPSTWHVSRAAITALGEQQARSVSGPAGSIQSLSVTPSACGPARSSATALSTPPLIATATRSGSASARKTCASAFASASTASVSPPTAAASSSVRPSSGRSRPGASAPTIRSPSTLSRTSANSAPRAESPTTSTMRASVPTGRNRHVALRKFSRSEGSTRRCPSPARSSSIFWCSSRRAPRYAVELACAIDPDLLDDSSLAYGFILHDVGKIAIPDRILLKPARLTAAERAQMQMHTVLGEQMLDKYEFLHGEGLRVVRSHHERWDGSGYPDGLPGSEVSLGVRIFAVADALDAMTSPRPYRRPRLWNAAVAGDRASSGQPVRPRRRARPHRDRAHVTADPLSRRKRRAPFGAPLLHPAVLSAALMRTWHARWVPCRRLATPRTDTGSL